MRSPLVLALISALLGALVWGSCERQQVSEAERRVLTLLAERASADSLAQLARHEFEREMTGLRQDSARLAQALVRSTQSAVQARRTVDSLLAQAPDSVHSGFDTALTRITAFGTACTAALANCEARAANAEARRASDSLRLAATRALLDTVEGAWKRAQRQHAPGFLGLRRFWLARSWTIPLATVTALLIWRR